MKDRTISSVLIAKFEHHLTLDERVPAAIEKYLRDIRNFVAWLDNRPLDKTAAAGWKDHLRSSGLCPETVNSKLSVSRK